MPRSTSCTSHGNASAEPSFLVLATGVDGGGGIERATRTLAQALIDLWGPERVRVLSVWADSGDPELPPYGFWAASARTTRSGRVPLKAKAAYLRAALKAGFELRHRGLVVIACHVELAPVAWAAATAAGAHFAVWCHGREAWHRLGPLVRHSLERAALVFAPSRFSARTAERAAGMVTGKVRVVPHGLSPEFTVHDHKPQGQVIVSVARLVKENRYKGIELLLRAMPRIIAAVPGAELVIVGDGAARPELAARAEALGVSGRVRFAGRVSDPDLAAVLARARVFAMPSRTRLGRRPEGEGFGLVFLEAAAAGLPVVAGRGGAAEEVVADGVSGLLADPEDERQVALAVTRLLTDHTLARRLGMEGRSRASRLFSFPAFRYAVSLLVKEVLAGETGTPAEAPGPRSRLASVRCLARRTPAVLAIGASAAISLLAVFFDLSRYDPFGPSLRWSPAVLLASGVSTYLWLRAQSSTR